AVLTSIPPRGLTPAPEPANPPFGIYLGGQGMCQPPLATRCNGASFRSASRRRSSTSCSSASHASAAASLRIEDVCLPERQRDVLRAGGVLVQQVAAAEPRTPCVRHHPIRSCGTAGRSTAAHAARRPAAPTPFLPERTHGSSPRPPRQRPAP